MNPGFDTLGFPHPLQIAIIDFLTAAIFKCQNSPKFELSQAREVGGAEYGDDR